MLWLVIFEMCLAYCLGASHFQTFTYITAVSKEFCIQRSSSGCDCGWWDCDCWTHYWMECHTYYENEQRERQVCQTGWTSWSCDVPICNTPCQGGKVCTLPDTCSCLTTGGASCTAVGCSDSQNCYPGSCSGGRCQCPPSFSDSNCQTINQTPEIQACNVQLVADTVQIAQANCQSPGLQPEVTWISGQATITKLQSSWEVVYTNPISMPDRTAAPNVQNSPSPIGVTSSALSVSFTGLPVSPISCPGVSSASPTGDAKCTVVKTWSEFGVTLKHNDSFTVSVRASLGGQKLGAAQNSIPWSNFPSQPFSGTSTSRSVQFKVDSKSPVHCLTQISNDCPVFPIFLAKDITTNPQIQPTFVNWTDDGSGIFNFHVEVYFMQPAPPNNRLVNTGASLQTSDINPSLQNNFIYVCTTSGVYSIELTVYDQANNSAKARKLFVYNKDSKLQTDATKPVFVREADPTTGYTWITNLNNIPRSSNGSYLLTLDWTGHFTSSASFSGSWALGADPWPPGKGIDDLDSYKHQYGFRTISAMTNLPNGITSYSVGVVVDEINGGRGLAAPNTKGLNATSNAYTFSVPRIPDGSAIVVWLDCNDVAGGLANEKLTINVDTTPPSLANYTFTPKSVDEFTSSFAIWAYDTGSGIKFLNFTIYDQTLKQSIHSDLATIHMRDPPTNANNGRKRRQTLEQACTSDDKTCYCVPQGRCFNYIQTINIDHCWIDRLAGDMFQIKFTATNFGGLTTSEQQISLGILKDIPCRPQPTPAPVSGGVIAGIVIGVIIGILVLIAAVIIVVMLVRVYAMKKPVPRAIQSVRQRFAKNAVITDNDLYLASPDANQIMAQKDNRYRKSPAESGTSKLEYQQNDDVYIYSADSEYISNPKQMNGYWIPKEKVEVENVLSSGRLMVISKAHLTDGNQRNVVAVKALKNGFSSKDLKLMETKIDFMARLKSHVNIVKFIGAIQNDGIEGPIMVMEFCETTLQQWLSNNSSITVDVLENMLTFCLNIARGLEHLHMNKIIHTRMAVRNVLLAKQFGGHVAKLIGFGPNRESEDKEHKVSVPIKWMAPETLKTVNSTKPTYNEKTDVWSFAITVWEIYSKGEQPYPNVSGSEAKNRIKAGEKMDCPDNCPYELFNKVIFPCWEMDSNRRPTMKAICGQIEDYRNGTGSEPIGYYDTTKDGNYSSNIRNNARCATQLYDEAR